MLVLTLPYPPSVNHYWRHVSMNRRKTVLISKEGRQYRQAVYEAVIQHRERKAPAGRLEVGILAHVPDRRTRDLDNLPKAILDALTHAQVIEDDGLIDRLVVERAAQVSGGQIKVFIQEMNP